MTEPEPAAKPQAYVTEDDAADAALAYAIWDSENSVKMKPACIQEHIARAVSVRRWLRIHGHDVRSLSRPAADRGQIVEECANVAARKIGPTRLRIAVVAAIRALSPAPAQTEDKP